MWIVNIIYFVIFALLVIWFFASWYASDLWAWIVELKNGVANFVWFFGVDPIFWIVFLLIAVSFVLWLVLAFKPK
jgi:hypothetical protein